MTSAILFKRPELSDELKRADPRIVVVTLYAAGWSLGNLGKPLIVTRIESHRTEVEGLYGAGAKPSVHEVFPCRGVDVRVRGHYTAIEATQLVQAVNFAFEYHRGGSAMGIQTALHETVEVMRRLGRVNPSEDMEHIHLQVPPVPRGESNKVRLWWPA